MLSGVGDGLLAVVTTYSYDTHNRLTGLSYSDGTPPVTYTYDAGGSPAFALGRLTSITDGTGSETYTYDQLGRITTVAKVVGSGNYNIGYGYNYVGQIKTLTYPDGILVNQSYDPAGRLSQISSGSTNYLTVPSTSYNAASLPTSLTYGSGVQATIGYNTRLQLASIDYAKGPTDLLNLTYNYIQTVNGNSVNNGQIQGVTDTRGNAYSTSYAYDALGRLAQGQTLNLTAANTWKLGWVYDRYGNRSQQNLLGGTISTTAPQLTIDPTTNRVTTSGYSYDAVGNLQADGTFNSYTYDAENRVKTFSNGTTSATYSYDGKGLRVKKVVGANTTVYVFSGGKVIAEYANGTLSVKYVYAGRQLLATLYPSTTTPVLYHYPDHLSARLETTPYGVVTRTFGHLPFGETWYETGVSDKQKFTSYERDNESGLDYAMFRYDSTRLGRFMTPDPLGGAAWDPQSLNRYAYALNDAVRIVDPLGLFAGICGITEDCSGDGGFVDPSLFSFDFLMGVGGQRHAPLIDQSGGGGDPIKAALTKLQQALNTNPDCLAFLNSAGGNVLKDLDTIQQNNLVGEAEIPPTTFNGSTFVRNAQTPGSVVGQAITVNTLGAFFNSSYNGMALTTDRGRITGGTSAAQGFILLHELAHFENVIKPDADPKNNPEQNQKQVNDNNKALEKKCKDAIKSF